MKTEPEFPYTFKGLAAKCAYHAAESWRGWSRLIVCALLMSIACATCGMFIPFPFNLPMTLLAITWLFHARATNGQRNSFQHEMLLHREHALDLAKEYHE